MYVCMYIQMYTHAVYIYISISLHIPMIYSGEVRKIIYRPYCNRLGRNVNTITIGEFSVPKQSIYLLKQRRVFCFLLSKYTRRAEERAGYYFSAELIRLDLMKAIPWVRI